MISVELARRLRDAGLEWLPEPGDRFVIPDRDLDDTVFAISEMTVEVRDVPGGRLIAFNGTTEWALDAIMQREVVWLPHEAQLRGRLGARFHALVREGDRYRCEIRGHDGRAQAFEAPDAAEAYGEGLLRVLIEGRASAAG